MFQFITKEKTEKRRILWFLPQLIDEFCDIFPWPTGKFFLIRSFFPWLINEFCNFFLETDWLWFFFFSWATDEFQDFFSTTNWQIQDISLVLANFQIFFPQLTRNCFIIIIICATNWRISQLSSQVRHKLCGGVLCNRLTNFMIISCDWLTTIAIFSPQSNEEFFFPCNQLK